MPFHPKYPPHTSETDAAIREAYRRRTLYSDRQAISRLAAKFEWPMSRICNRAVFLGVTSKVGPGRAWAWKGEEDAIIEQNIVYSLFTIRKKLRAKGFFRTPNAIRNRYRELSLSRVSNAALTLSDLVERLGVVHGKVSAWMHSGKLRAIRKGTGHPMDPWIIDDNELRRFVLLNPQEIDPTRIHPDYWLWFLSVVTGGALYAPERQAA